MSALADETQEERIVSLEAKLHTPRVQILSEPLTYQARLVRDNSAPRGLRAISVGERRSYIRDFVLQETRGDPEAKQRLDRHDVEMRAIGRERERLFNPDVEVEFEQRAVNWSAGTGGYFAPPLWIVEAFAMVPTPERVLASLAPQFELPVGAQSVNLPRLTLGPDVQPIQVTAPAMGVDITDTNVSSAVCTIAGNCDVPMQMLEQSPVGAHLDWVVFTAMEARYGFQLESQLFTGQGAAVPQGSGNNQLLGILNNTAIPAANIISYTGAGESSSSGATSMFGSLGQVMAAVGLQRKLPPEYWLMSTARVAWLGSSEDSQNRPLMIANTGGSGNFDLLAVSVRLDDAIPRTVNVNQEPIFACRPSDWIILESPRRTSVFTDVISGTLSARLQMRCYVAALLRYPSSVAYITGSGMATGGGF